MNNTATSPSSTGGKGGIFSSITSPITKTEISKEIKNEEMEESTQHVNKKRKLKQKRVTWNPELCQIKLYEVEVMQPVPNKNSYQQEYLSEKKMFEDRRFEHEKKLENMHATVDWGELKEYNFGVVKGTNSEEKNVQENRKLIHSMVSYQFDHEIPDSPVSPISTNSLVGNENQNILQTLTQDPNLLTQLLGLLQQPQGVAPSSNVESNPYQTMYSSNGNNSFQTNGNTSYQTNNVSPYGSLTSLFSNQWSGSNGNSGTQYYKEDFSNDPTSQQRCRYYNSPIGCKKGSKCEYLHSRDDYRI
jgi:hypothetical protein